VKFTPSGGTVSLQAGIDEQERMTLTVSDTGIGMNDDHIKKAVQPFGQIDSTLSRKYEGTGLGLPLTKGLMDIHGGTMEINSKLDVGTAVTLKFPPERVVGDA
jgi:signal transduction histidine kinase